MRVARAELREGEVGEAGDHGKRIICQSHGITSDMLMPRHNVPDTEPPMKLALPQQFGLQNTQDEEFRGGLVMCVDAVGLGC